VAPTESGMLLMVVFKARSYKNTVVLFFFSSFSCRELNMRLLYLVHAVAAVTASTNTNMNGRYVTEW
jgi:hypothetical protein